MNYLFRIYYRELLYYKTDRRTEFLNVDEESALKRPEEIVALKKQGNKKLRTLSGPRIDLGKVGE